MKQTLLALAFTVFCLPAFSQSDLCSGATSLTVNSSCVTTAYSVAGSFGSEIANPSCGNSNKDGYYTFTATATNTVITATTDQNLVLSVYTGSCGSLSQFACVDAANNGGTETLTLATTIGTTYYIRLSRGNNGGGAMTGNICVYSPPPGPSNDDPCSATTLTVGSSCSFASYSNSGSTATSGVANPTCSSYSTSGTTGDVWFQVTVPASGNLIIDTDEGTLTDCGMAIYSGTCSSLTEITCDDDGSSNGLMPYISASSLTPGSTIWIRVWEYGCNSSGTFSICVYSSSSSGPTNDDPCTATALTVGSTCSFSTYTTAGATSTTGAPAPGCASYSGGDVWFTVTVPASGSLVFDSNTGVVTDGGMAIYSGTCNSLTLIDCDDDGSANGLMPYISSNSLTPGSTIWIRFWEYGNDNPGTFQLCVYDNCPSGAPANDNPCSATALTVGATCTYTNSTNACATATSGAPAPGCGNYLGGDVWFSVVVPASGALNIDSNTGTMTDGGMALYSGTCSSLTLITCDNDNSANGLMPAIFATGLTPGSTVYIRFWEYGNDNNGTFSICVTDPCPGGSPVNDLPCNATALTLNVNLGGNNGCSSNTSEPTAPSCWSTGSYNTVWYSVVCPASGQLKIRTTLGTLTNTQIALYSGTCSSLSLVSGGCNVNAPACGSSTYYNSEITATGLTPGATYYIAVDGNNSLTGTFDIMAVDGSLGFPPAAGQDCFIANPVCNQTLTVGNPGYQAYGNNCDFTGSGICLASGERGSAWYQININGNGTLAFDIVPNDWPGAPSTSSTDYDFAIWKVAGSGTTTTCSGILSSPTTALAACNYSGLGLTGCAGTGNAPAAYPGFDGAYEPAIPVSNGDIYMLVISNFSNSTSGFTLNFSGTSPINYSASPTSITWSGGTSSAWAVSSNWGGCATPVCGIDATIVPSSTNQPVISANATVRDLTINSGATLTINAGVTLTICGNFVNNGNLIADPTSTILFSNGSVNQSLSGSMVGADKFGNLTITKTGGTVLLNANIDIGGNFTTSNSTSVFNTNGNGITVSGNFNNAAGATTFTNVTGGSLTFNGTAAQNYVAGANSLVLNNVIMNHTGPGVTLVGNNMNIGGTLTLTQGKIITNALEVNVSNSATSAVSTGNTSSYVQGFLRRRLNSTGSYDFPVGHATKGYQRANVNFTGATTINNLRASFNAYATVPGALNLTECAVTYNLPALDNGYWTINAYDASNNQVTTANGTYDMTLYNLNYTNATGASGWTVMKDPGSGWGLYGNCAASTAGQVIRTGMSGFSNFGTAQSTAPLPIELLSFTGKSLGNRNLLEWITASETNNDYFTVERSATGTSFEEVTRVDGAGNSSMLLNYSAYDNSPFAGVTYYRLKQTDFDGKFTYSGVIAVENNMNDIAIDNIYPNPTNGDINLDFITPVKGTVVVQVIDAYGKLVYTKSTEIGEGKSTLITEMSQLAQGIYTFRLTFEEGNYSSITKIVKY